MDSTAGCGSASKAPAENSPTVTDASAESADTTVEKPSTTETAKNTEDSTEAVTVKPTTTEIDKKTTEAATEAVAVKPSTTEKPSTTVAPATTEKPSTTVAPSTTEKPAATEAPATTVSPATTERPATTEADVCSHNWVAVTKEVKTTKEIPVTKDMSVARCKACGWTETPPNFEDGTYSEHIANSGTKIVIVFGEEHEVPVCDKGAQGVWVKYTTYETVTETETVVDHYECSKCGAAK
ncbi:MAG: hypothetical protein NC428_02430 [Clostridium sp.]|nr:hypothetical protein [Clostridium sp.]